MLTPQCRWWAAAPPDWGESGAWQRGANVSMPLADLPTAEREPSADRQIGPLRVTDHNDFFFVLPAGWRV